MKNDCAGLQWSWTKQQQKIFATGEHVYGVNADGDIDEFRYGDTWTDVAGEPARPGAAVFWVLGKDSD